MKALQLVRWGAPPELREVPIPEPGPGQVVIAIAGAGACHSDLHLMEWPEGQLPWKLPFTVGHENAGRIHTLGAGVTGFAKGDPVLVYGPWGCGHCRPCRLGRENYCDNAAELGAFGGGLGIDGGMAEYMLVPSARFLVPIDGLDPVAAAPLADAGLTPYHAIAGVRDRLHPGSTAVVIGAGGLGQMAVQLLRATTASRVIVVDRDPAKLEISRMLGADLALDGRSADPIRKASGGVEVVLDMVGSNETLELGSKVLRAEGRLVIIGLALGALPVNFFSVPFGSHVSTSYWGTLTELGELVELARAKRIRLDVEKFKLASALDVYDKLRAGKIRGRAVVTPH